jgi:hypothetical protein
MNKSTPIKEHKLSLIDPERRNAVCSICGPVKISISRWRSTVVCENEIVASRPVRKGVQVKNGMRVKENMDLVNEYKRKCTCKRCGLYALEPGGFNFFELHLPEEQRISKLVRTVNPELLLIELEKRDMYCRICYRLVRREFVHKIRVPEYKPLPAHF